jgi:Fe2+ transport system protein FeoA
LTIWQLKPGSKAVVLAVNSEEEILIKRLSELGISKGQEIECVKKLPFGGPTVYALSDCLFSLEKSMAEKIFIKD